MKKLLVVLALAGMVLLVCSTSFAAASYVITNDDNCNNASNTSSIYSLNTTNGTLTHLKSVDTGGIGACGGFFATVSTGVGQDPTCLYVDDNGSSDIAAFSLPSLKKVGNYSNAALASGFPGGSIAVTPTSVYATYAATENIGAWKRNSDCSLTFVAAYQATAGADTYSNITIVPGGKQLIVSVDDLGFLEAFSINSDSSLTDLGNVNLATATTCSSSGDGCFPTAIDSDKTGRLFIGNASLTSTGYTSQFTAASPYFKGTKMLTLTNTANMVNNEVPFLNAAAYSTGTGTLYWGFSGFGAGEQPGVLASALTKGAVGTGVTTAISSANDYDGIIQTTGNWLVVAEWFNQLQVFSIGANGALTPTSQGPVTDSDADGALSFQIYPATR